MVIVAQFHPKFSVNVPRIPFPETKKIPSKRLLSWLCERTHTERVVVKSSVANRELKQNRTATATWGTRKRLFPRISESLQLCLFLSWLKFLPFLPKFYCFIVSKYERATVVISQKWCSRPVNNLKVKHLKLHVRHDDPEIMSISHIHVLLLSSAISLIVSLTLPSGSPVLVLKARSNCKWAQWSVSRSFLCKKYKLLLRSLRSTISASYPWRSRIRGTPMGSE